MSLYYYNPAHSPGIFHVTLGSCTSYFLFRVFSIKQQAFAVSLKLPESNNSYGEALSNLDLKCWWTLNSITTGLANSLACSLSSLELSVAVLQEQPRLFGQSPTRWRRRLLFFYVWNSLCCEATNSVWTLYMEGMELLLHLGECCRVLCVSICPFFLACVWKFFPFLCLYKPTASMKLFCNSNPVVMSLITRPLLWSASHWWIIELAGSLRWVLYIVWTVSIGYIGVHINDCMWAYKCNSILL